MSSKSLKLIINRCITDQDFCKLLVQNRDEAVKEYDLFPAERETLLNIQCDDLKGLVLELYRRGLVGDSEMINDYGAYQQ